MSNEPTKPQPHRMGPDTRTEQQRAADRAEVARTWPESSPEVLSALRGLFRPAVRRLRERQLAEAGVTMPPED